MEIIKNTAAQVHDLLFELMGDFVYPVINPTDSDEYVIYRNAGSNLSTTKDGLSEYNALFDIILVTTNYLSPVETMDATFDLFTKSGWDIFNYNENWSEGRFIITFQVSQKFNF